MSFFSILAPLAAPLLGGLLDKDSAKSPSAPPPINLDELARMMFTNTKSPFGGMTYTEGDDGQWTGEYKFSDEVQPVFDRRVERSLNPDQAYQMPPEMQQLQSALMQRRLAGNTPARAMPERRPANVMPPAGFPVGYSPRPEGGYG